jgi:hypothetical protein
LPSHLKAICLASKAWDELARPLLYRKVTINVFDEDEVARFERCMNAGAQAHLDGTRSLTLMDSLPPPEAPEFQVQAHRHFYKAEKLRPVEIGQIRAVLAYFLPNRLHTFRSVTSLLQYPGGISARPVRLHDMLLPQNNELFSIDLAELLQVPLDTILSCGDRA